MKIWRIILNDIVITTKTEPIVCGCGFLAASESFYHADRVLDFNILIYVVDGTIYVSEEDTDYEINSGELLFLKSGRRHFGKREIARGTKWFYAHFYLDEPDEDCAPFEPDASSLGAYEPISFSAVLPKKLSGLRKSRTEQRLSELAEYCNSGDGLKRMRINGMFSSLLTDIALERYSGKRTDTLSDRICAWLDEHSGEAFSSARLEREFFLSYKRMAAVFRKEQGMTMQQYHTGRRMSRACFMLRSTLIPIGEIADTLGYDDPLYFSRCFRVYSGMSPRSYRLCAKSNY